MYINDKLSRFQRGLLTASLESPRHSDQPKIAPWNLKLTSLLEMEVPPERIARRGSQLSMRKNVSLKEDLSTRLRTRLKSTRIFSTYVDDTQKFKMANFKPRRNHNEQLKYELVLLKEGRLPAMASPSSLTMATQGLQVKMITKEITGNMINI